MRKTVYKIWDVLYPFIFFLLCLLLVTLAALVIAGLVVGAAPTEVILRSYPVIAILVNIGFYSITLLTQWKVYKKDDLRFGERKNCWKAWQIAVAAGLTMLAAAGLNLLILISPLPRIFPGYYESSEASFAGQPWPLLILAVVILGPMAEELIFRGLVYERMKHYLSIPLSVFLSALLFGIYHANMIQLIYATLMGILLAYYYEKSGSLPACVIAHMAMNAFAVTSFL